MITRLRYRRFATLGPLYGLSDCVHGCSGSPSCGLRCTFVCHDAEPL